VNGDFQTLPAGGLNISCAGTGCAFSQGAIPGWTTTNNGGAASGQWQPGSNTIYFNSLSGTDVIAYTNGGTIDQLIGAVVPNQTYTLTVDVGMRKDTAISIGNISLLLGSTTVGTGVGVAPTPGNFSTFTATFTSAANAAGNLTIRLAANGVQGEFNNVALSAVTAVPEPATIGLIGLGLLGLGSLRRKF
jgi:hypothetical protein